MTELGPYAVQILEHLQADKDFKRHYDAEPLFHQWENYVRRISFFNRYPDMTDHGPAHANSVVSLVAQLALPPRDGQEKSPLNASELFCLTGAAWLHDIGMYTTGELDVFDPESVRKRHCCLSRDKMREEREILFPGLPESDVKLISAIAAYHQSRTALDDDHRAALAKKAAEKGKTHDFVEGMPTLAEEVLRQGWSDSIASLERLLGPEGRAGGPSAYRQPIRMKLLGALVRLLDQCDIQMIRAGNLDFLMRRVDRSDQQRGFYEGLVKAIGPAPEGDESRRLHGRLLKEVGYFSETQDYYLRDFWVERTFIVAAPPAPKGALAGAGRPAVTRRIYIKMNDEAVIRAQMGLIPPSLESTKDKVLEATKPVADYLDHATHYVLKELEFLQKPYLDPAGLGVEVLTYPTDPAERRALQMELRRRSPYRDPSPERPAVYERLEATTELVSRLASGREGRILVVYGPVGRGRRQFVRALGEAYLQARGRGDFSRVWWHVIEGGSLVQEAVHGAGSYLASLGEYALFNVVHEESLVGDKHARFCLDTLAKGDAPEVVVLEGLNKVDTRSRPFFRELFRALEKKFVIAVTTRWPSADAAGVYFGGFEDEARYLECPRLSQLAGRRLLERLAGGAKLRGDEAAAWVDDWTGRWEAWGRESHVLAVLARNLWVSAAKVDLLRSIVEGSVRAEVAEAWSKLGDQKTQRVALEAATAGGHREGQGARLVVSAPNAQIQELVDRGLARGEETPGESPWPGDDVLRLLHARVPPRETVWLHPAFGRCFQTS